MKKKVIISTLILSTLLSFTSFGQVRWFQQDGKYLLAFQNLQDVQSLVSNSSVGVFRHNTLSAPLPDPQNQSITYPFCISSGWAGVYDRDGSVKYYCFGSDGFLDPNYDVNGYDVNSVLTAINRVQGSNSNQVQDINTADLMPTCPFNDVEVFKDTIGANGTQFPLYALFMNQGVTNTVGNAEFLGNNDQITNFTHTLNVLEYKNDKYTDWVTKLKELYTLGSAYFGAKTGTILDKDVLRAKVEKDNNVNKKVFQDLFDAILKVVGALLVLYGFIIIIFGALDESGSIGDAMLLEKATRGALSADRQGQYFRVRYIALGLFVAFLGVLVFTGMLVKVSVWIINIITKIYHKLIGKL